MNQCFGDTSSRNLNLFIDAVAACELDVFVFADGDFAIVVESPVWATVFVDESPSSSNHFGVERYGAFLNKTGDVGFDGDGGIADGSYVAAAVDEDVIRQKIEGVVSELQGGNCQVCLHVGWFGKRDMQGLS